MTKNNDADPYINDMELCPQSILELKKSSTRI